MTEPEIRPIGNVQGVPTYIVGRLSDAELEAWGAEFGMTGAELRQMLDEVYATFGRRPRKKKS